MAQRQKIPGEHGNASLIACTPHNFQQQYVATTA
jgi:hypothetical protein